jgi:hypothetical protein
VPGGKKRRSSRIFGRLRRTLLRRLAYLSDVPGPHPGAQFGQPEPFAARLQPSIRFGPGNSMTIEHPRFPTPEDERRAALIYWALRQSADVDKDILPATRAPDIEPRASSAKVFR